MTNRLLCGGTCAVLVLFCGNALFAQVTQEEFDKLEKRVKDLEDGLGDLTNNVVDPLVTNVTNLDNSVRTIVEETLPTLGKDIGILKDRVEDISEDSDEPGRYILSVLGNMKRSEKFRQQHVETQEGTFVLTNPNNQRVQFRVNGRDERFDLHPHGSRELPMALGTVSIRTRTTRYEWVYPWGWILRTTPWTHHTFASKHWQFQNNRMEFRLTMKP